MSDEIKRVGFLGLGRMGGPIALNILKAGFQVSIYNRSRDKIKPFVEKGATAAATPREAAANADVVLTCLLDDQSVLDQATGPDGILQGLRPGKIHIGATTISPGCASKLAEMHKACGSTYIAGPVVGRPDAAASGQLLTYVAGDRDTIEKCAPLFAAYTKSYTIVGTNPAVANSVKLTVNFMVISMVELMGEAYAFGEKSGVEPQLVTGLIQMLLNHPVMPQYADRIRERQFEQAGFELKSGFKDVLLMLQASTDVRAPLPYASTIREKFLTALANGMDTQDWSGIYEVTRRQAGLA